MVPCAGQLQLQAECHVSEELSSCHITRWALTARAHGFAEVGCSGPEHKETRPAVCPIAGCLLNSQGTPPQSVQLLVLGRIASHLVYSQAVACQSMLGMETAALRPGAGHMTCHAARIYALDAPGQMPLLPLGEWPNMLSGDLLVPAMQGG